MYVWLTGGEYDGRKLGREIWAQTRPGQILRIQSTIDPTLWLAYQVSDDARDARHLPYLKDIPASEVGY